MTLDELDQLRVHALTTDRGGCFHYRIRQPLAALRRLGHWTSWGSGVDAGTYERANVIVGQYLHYPETVEWWCRQAEAGGRLFVWEADDDIWQVTAVTGHGNAYDDPDTVPRMERAIAAAHLVTVTTPELGEAYARINPNVVVLPNSVPDWLLDWEPPARRDSRFTIGYSCSPSHQEDLQWFAPTLAIVMEGLRPKLRLYGPEARPIGVPDSWRVEALGWVRQVEEYLRTLSFDVGIAPLAPMRFNRGKSGIKALEYLALGIPAVVSNFPQYRAVMAGAPAEAGAVCRSQGEWCEALYAAFTGRQGPQEPARAARRAWAAQWAQSRTVRLWEDAYRKGLVQL